MAPELVMLIGLQGSGKSTFYREQFAATHVLVSKDLMRNARRREERQQKLVAEALAAGQPVVVDNTNPGPDERRGVLALARAHGVPTIAYWFDAPLAVCFARNAAREGKANVPPVAIFATRARLKAPGFEEGFDRIFVVRSTDDGSFAVTEMTRDQRGAGVAGLAGDAGTAGDAGDAGLAGTPSSRSS